MKLVSGSKGKMKVQPELALVLLCRKMRWTYQEYVNQPDWFIDILRMVELVDAQKAANDAAEQEQKTKEAARGKH